MGRPLKDKRNYWSDDHRYLLAWAAQRVNRWLAAHDRRTLDPWDLMIEGWWHCFRRCRTRRDLKKAVGHTVQSMLNYAINSAFLPHTGNGNQDDIAYDRIKEEVEAHDELIHLLQQKRMDARGFAAAAWTDGFGLTNDQAGRKMGLCGERVRQLRKEFLAEARTKLKG